MRVSAAVQNCRGAIRSRPACFLCEAADERRIGDQRLRFIGVQGLDQFGNWRGYRQPRSIGASGAELGEQAVRHVQRRGGPDTNHAGALRDPLNFQQAEDAGDGNLPSRLVIDHDATHAGRAAARDDAIFAEQRFARAFPGQVPLGVSQAQAPVCHDPIELCHQRRLRQDRQLPRLMSSLPKITDDPAVVGRTRDRVLHDCAQAPPLEFEQSRARPALAIDNLSGQSLDPLAACLYQKRMCHWILLLRIDRRSSRREKHAGLPSFSGANVGRQRFTTMSGGEE